MLSLPSKPWKRIRVEQQGPNRYVITFISPMKEEKEFRKALREDLASCLSEGDTLSDPKWDAKSVVLTTEDFETFKRRLVYVCIIIEEES